MTLRKYQQDAVDSLFKFQEDRPGKSSVIVIPTGGGKTRVMAEVIRKSFGINPDCRVMILSHVKELLEQSHKTCLHYATETGLDVCDIGVYSASLKSRQVKKLTIAGIQSIHRKADLFGKIDIIMVDECHLISTNAETMYRRFLSAISVRNSNVKVVGLTATPYRLQTGLIFGGGKTFDDCCYAIGVKDLITDGFLSPLITVGYKETIDLRKVKKRGGEFLPSSLDAVMEDDALVTQGVKETIQKTQGRNSILVFASSVRHAEMILAKLKEFGELSSELITGETDQMIRDFKINAFRTKGVRWLVNIAVLTTGFDAPEIDCVVVMRPTMSRGLWYQMVGRGFRLSKGKENCLILDFGENALRHGCIDHIELGGGGIEKPAAKVKKCPACQHIHKVSIPICPSCGFFKIKEERPEIPTKLSDTQTEGDILLGQRNKEYDIVASVYTIYRKHPGADPCIMETHETLGGTLIKGYHSLKVGLEYPVSRWLRSIKAQGVPKHHWDLNKEMLQSREWLDTLPSPKTIKAHRNDKGYFVIDEYNFLETAKAR